MLRNPNPPNSLNVFKAESQEYFRKLQLKCFDFQTSFSILNEKSRILLEKGKGAVTYVELEDALNSLANLIDPAFDELEKVEKDLQEWPSFQEGLQFWPERYDSLTAELDRIENVLLDYGYEPFKEVVDPEQIEKIDKEEVLTDENEPIEKSDPAQMDEIRVGDEDLEEVNFTLESLGLSSHSMALLSTDILEDDNVLSSYLPEPNQFIQPFSEEEYVSLDGLVTAKLSLEKINDVCQRLSEYVNGEESVSADPNSPTFVFSSIHVLEEVIGLESNERRAFILAAFKTKRLRKAQNQGDSKDFLTFPQ